MDGKLFQRWVSRIELYFTVTLKVKVKKINYGFYFDLVNN